MKHRPPIRTSEILAYNWGAASRAAGWLPSDLAPDLEFDVRPALSVGELEALTRLGPDAFEKWALKGWVESPPPGGVN